MTTAEILKRLESAKSEAEMLAMAEKLGLTRAFFNVGSVVDMAAEPLPKTGKPKELGKGKTHITQFLTKSKQAKKKVRRPPVGA